METRSKRKLLKKSSEQLVIQKNQKKPKLQTVNTKPKETNPIQTNMSRFSTLLSSLLEAQLFEQLEILLEISEFLSMAQEEQFTSYSGRSSGFDTEAWIKALLGLFENKSAMEFQEIPPELRTELGMIQDQGVNPELLMLACRCLFNMIEACPSSLLQLVHADGVRVLVAKLSSIEYIDLAESILSILDKIAGEFPSSILKGNGILASLQYIDFFNIHVQRMAISIAANATRGLSLSRSSSSDTNVDLIKEIMPILIRLTTYTDSKIVENTCRALSRIIDWAVKQSLADVLISQELVDSLINLTRSSCLSITPNSTPLLTNLIKMLNMIVKTSPSLTLNMVPDLISIVTLVFSGNKPLDSFVLIESLSCLSMDLILSVLDLILMIFPPLPRQWSFCDLNLNIHVDHSCCLYISIYFFIHIYMENRITQNPSLLKEYLVSILPIMIELFGITVYPTVCRKSLECISKIIWYSPDLSCISNSMMSKLISNVCSLPLLKETTDNSCFTATGLFLTWICLERNKEKFGLLFEREGILDQVLGFIKMEMETDSMYVPMSIVDTVEVDLAMSTTDLLTKESPTIESSVTLPNPNTITTNETTSDNPARQLLNTIVSDLQSLGDSESRGVLQLLCQQETSSFSSSNNNNNNPKNDIKCLNGEFTSFIKVQEWARFISKEIINTTRDVLKENQDLKSKLKELNQRLHLWSSLNLQERLSCLNQFASYLIGSSSSPTEESSTRMETDSKAKSETKRGITGFELLSSEILTGLQVFLYSQDPFNLMVFNHVFLNGPLSTSNLKYSFVPGSCIALVQTCQELVSKTEDFKVSCAIPSTQTMSQPSSVIALLSSIVGLEPLGSREARNPSLQLSRQVRIKLVASDPCQFSCQFQTMVISIHAVATFKALAEYLKNRFPLFTTEKDSLIPMDDSEDVLDAEEDVIETEEDDEEELHVFHNPTEDEDEEWENDHHLSTILLQGEQDSRLNRPRGDSNVSRVDSHDINNRDSVIEFPPESKSKSRRKSSVGGRRSTRSSVSNANACKEFQLEFYLNDKLIPNDSTIFGALYKHESLSNENPNIWNNVTCIYFKRVSSSPLITESFSIDGSPSKESTSFQDSTSCKESKDQVSIILLILIQIHQILQNYKSIVLKSLNQSIEYGKEYSGPFLSLPSSLFLNNKITAKLNRQLDEPLIVASRVVPDWCAHICREYPFLLPFETRIVYLQSNSFGYSRNMARWQQGSSLELKLGRIQRQKVRISRDKIVHSMMKIMDSFGPSQALLEVEFFDEVGTGLGPTLEFYSLVCGALCVPIPFGSSSSLIKLWRDSDLLFPRPLSGSLTKGKGKMILDLFKALGTLVAKALLDSRVLDLPLSPVFIELVVYGELKDSFNPWLALKRLDLSFYNSTLFLVESMQSLESSGESYNPNFRANPRVDELGLDFTLPGYPEYELIKNGQDIPITLNNLSQYIQCILDATVGSGILPQIKAFKRGFNKVFPISDLQIFTLDELSILLGGGGSSEQDWSCQVIKENLLADHGFNKDSLIIDYLAQMMSSFNHQEQRDFLQFVTGSPRLPFGGFKALNPPLTIVRKTVDGNTKPDDYLPSVMTCVNYLKIPDYSSLEIMTTQFKTAIVEGQGCFHLS